ncbi:MAG: hypothetical protein UW58_C0035G0011 [Candidatus Collierbacteria bacterium GW2011_GWC2_44_30]|nr:MAG: hypothetical protein UW58_C0035G0011 [Candidatus Collierbacteria bacterium GW2011_GWC2_44_30]
MLCPERRASESRILTSEKRTFSMIKALLWKRSFNSAFNIDSILDLSAPISFELCLLKAEAIRLLEYGRITFETKLSPMFSQRRGALALSKRKRIEPSIEIVLLSLVVAITGSSPRASLIDKSNPCLMVYSKTWALNSLARHA